MAECGFAHSFEVTNVSVSCEYVLEPQWASLCATLLAGGGILHECGTCARSVIASGVLRDSRKSGNRSVAEPCISSFIRIF